MGRRASRATTVSRDRPAALAVADWTGSVDLKETAVSPDPQVGMVYRVEVDHQDHPDHRELWLKERRSLVPLDRLV